MKTKIDFTAERVKRTSAFMVQEGKWKIIVDLVGNELCVPVSTPDNYAQIAFEEYKAKSKMLSEVGKRINAQLEHDARWPLGPEAHGDQYLVEEKGFQL